MKAFIRRKCRDDPIRDSTQISLYYYASGKAVDYLKGSFHDLFYRLPPSKGYLVSIEVIYRKLVNLVYVKGNFPSVLIQSKI